MTLRKLLKSRLSDAGLRAPAAEQDFSPAAHVKETRKIAAATTRADLVALESRSSSKDNRFRQLVADADAARDTSAWVRAEALYREALELYPYSPGYRVQYAHMLKEQGAFPAAELHYRSAYALGIPAQDIAPHLNFVVERNGQPTAELPAINLAVPAMDAPPTALDIEILGVLMFHGGSISLERSLQLIRRCRTIKDVALTMIADDRFRQSSGSFLEVLRVTR